MLTVASVSLGLVVAAGVDGVFGNDLAILTNDDAPSLRSPLDLLFAASA